MNFSDGENTGCLAFSIAGHDKGRLYVVTGQFYDMILLSDGDLKKVSSPKKKKLKHIQLIKKERLSSERLNDTDIKRAIKMFLTKCNYGKDGKEAD